MYPAVCILFILMVLTDGTEGSVNCTSHPCEDVPDFCLNSGTCYHDSATCQTGCHCTASFSGERCEHVTDPIASTTLRPMLERECIHGFVCVHGFCDTDGSSFSCACDSGWEGFFCEIFECPIKCPSNTECVFISGKFECKENDIVTTIHSSSTSFVSVTSVPTIASQTPTINISTTTLRPESERQCIPGFVCVHGYCDRDGSSFSCICDSGWIGYFCETFKCPVNCPENTDCVLVSGSFECKMKPLPTTLMTTSFPTTSLRPVSERECLAGFVCIHGFCDKEDNSFYCVCDSGWKGSFCEQFICPLNCPSNTNCDMVDNTFICKTKESTTKPSTMPSSTLRTSTVSADNTTAVHVCSANYTKRPLSERQCMPNFICEYGACEMTQDDTGAVLECICDDGGLGGLCQGRCCMPCSEYGQCKTRSNGTEFCQCMFDREGDLCDMIKVPSTLAPSSIEVDLWPLWVSAIVLVCVIAATVLLFFWMWRNRVTIVMKIVHYFQAYEDDDEKTWDAFVSYKSSDVDENFVLHKLFPKLEKELGFTLCLHHRDFLPGETIANNIINAIDNSRRTILILTPRFVTSDFTRFEYQVAQQQMLKRTHKIIPILLEDISHLHTDMDRNLKQIIKSVTYIEYPGEDASEKKANHFWKKLSLSMPKKRAVEERRKQPDFVKEEKKAENIIDKYPNDMKRTPDKNDMFNPTFVTDIVIVVDDQNNEKKEDDPTGNPQGTHILECTHF
ncbi:neurogenic locus notch homolog protein 2-like [Pecten maximus]|uniref:neurogenic locus notch homolog protein 2-like n=1 Tax=Pecten maximus TaxID=6579 RepID=UPI00145901C0|nr:neurogenic locus notch homolog protein 2-like [Pecten maximus]